jgi:hypothetical protein
MRLPSILFALVLSVLGLSCQIIGTDSRPFSFGGLLSGDEVEVHRIANDSIMVHSDCTIRVRGGNPPTARARGLFDDALGHPVQIDSADLTRLDEALRFYRTCPTASGSERKVRLEITWLRDGIIALEETLVAETRADAVPPSALDFDALAMKTGVPRDRMEVINELPSWVFRGHPVEAPKKD